MMKFLARRVVTAVPLLFFVSFAMFLLIALTPGDPAYRLAGENATPEQVEQVRKALRLDDPLLVRYATWLTNAVRGDLGKSMSTTEPVTGMILQRIPVTLSLAGMALAVSVVVGLAAGVLAALHPGGSIDRAVAVMSSLGIALPSFWLALLLVVFFAVERPWLPAIAYRPISDGVGEWLQHLILPAISLGALPAAEMAMQLRGALVEVLNREYILAAKARGLSSLSIVVKHAMKNAAIPVVTVLGFRIAQLLGGAVVIESVFVMNGLGTLAVSAALSSDVPVLLGLTMLTTSTVVVVNLLVDASYFYFNPKIRGI